MAITVDEAFLDKASKINDKIAQEVLFSPKGDLTGIVVLPGHSNFGLGNNVKSVVAKIGSDLHARLTELHDTASDRSLQLRMFMAITDDTEDMNNLTAQDFLTKTPAWKT